MYVPAAHGLLVWREVRRSLFQLSAQEAEDEQELRSLEKDEHELAQQDMQVEVPNSAHVTAWKNKGTPIPPCSGRQDVDSQPSSMPLRYAALNS